MNTKAIAALGSLIAVSLLASPVLGLPNEGAVATEETPTPPGPDEIVEFVIKTCNYIVKQVQPGRQCNWH